MVFGNHIQINHFKEQFSDLKMCTHYIGEKSGHFASIFRKVI